MNTKTLDTTKYTAHQHPGKFEGESAECEYYYGQMMNGDGERIYAFTNPEDGLEDTPCAELFTVTAEEAEAFGLPVGATYMIREDGQGFVYGSVHWTRELAEGYFRNWLGLPSNPEESK